jgi:murein L,D-transpeptidase YcbB/YkuD
MKYFIGYLLGISLLIGCTEQQQKKSAADSTKKITVNDLSIPGNFSTQTLMHFDSSQLKKFLLGHDLFKPFAKDMEVFYHNRNYAFAWYDRNGLIEQAANLFNRLENIEAEGLTLTVPYKKEFEELIDSSRTETDKLTPSVPTELMLTAQYFFYAKNVWQGLPEQDSKAVDWFLPRKKINLQQAMDSLLSSKGSALVSNEPVYKQYDLLKKYLASYRDLAKSYNWTPLKITKKSYKPGDSSAIISQIRNRLFVLKDLATDNASPLYDTSLETGVKNFQTRMGLTADGVIGPEFMRQLNTPLTDRIQQIIVNMERCRWVPASISGDYLVVNIPAFKLYAYENDSLVWDMNVVTGKAVHKTVIFNGKLKYIVFSPYWNVPASIKNNEILPALRRDPQYLVKNNMEWYGNNIRQKPGPKNSLGLVKFLFPNSHNIYLHDTPAKSLFNFDQRAFSHGCIRVAEARKLAQYLLRNDSAWNEAKIDAAMHSGKEQYVTLKNEIPVFIAYFTAWVDKQGNINFRNDIYNRDKRLAEMMLQ